MSRLHRSLETLAKAGTAIESALLVFLLLCMIGLSTAQIVLRNFFDIGFYWSDTVLRTLVLWIALAGAVAASRSDKHISINLVDNLLSGRTKDAVKLLVHSFSAAICGLVTWFSLQFALTTREYGDIAFGSIPAWLLQLVLPVGFGLICYRYALFCVADAVRLLTNRAGGEQSR